MLVSSIRLGECVSLEAICGDFLERLLPLVARRSIFKYLFYVAQVIRFNLSKDRIMRRLFNLFLMVVLVATVVTFPSTGCAWPFRKQCINPSCPVPFDPCPCNPVPSDCTIPKTVYGTFTVEQLATLLVQLKLQVDDQIPQGNRGRIDASFRSLIGSPDLRTVLGPDGRVSRDKIQLYFGGELASLSDTLARLQSAPARSEK